MSKELSEMTLEELWELFPISLVEHQEKWNGDYKEIESVLQKLLSDCRPHRISHIGSTAIFKIGIFSNIGWVVDGLLFVINPVCPTSSEGVKNIHLWIRLAGIIVIIIGVTTHFVM